MERLLAAQQTAATATNANASEVSSLSQPPCPASMPTPVHGLISNARQHQQQSATPSLQTWSAPSIMLTMAGKDAFINICLPAAATGGVKHQIDVVTSTISADPEKSLFRVHARKLNEESLESTEGLTPEAKYKLAVSELMVGLSE
uniref:Uncharacterized protein n=1 Tax=Leersia perrieri TaxID=77586 RepID=A0A0D9W4Z6_9ORYZ